MIEFLKAHEMALAITIYCIGAAGGLSALMAFVYRVDGPPFPTVTQCNHARRVATIGFTVMIGMPIIMGTVSYALYGWPSRLW